MLIDRDNRNHNAVFGEMFAVADHDFFDLLERARVYAHAARRHRFAPVRGVLGEFDGMAILEQHDLSRDRPHLVRQRGMAKELPVFSVNRDEVARTHQVEHQLLLFLAGVPRNVQQAPAIVVIHQRLAAVHMIEHPKNRFLVPGMIRADRMTVSFASTLSSR